MAGLSDALKKLMRDALLRPEDYWRDDGERIAAEASAAAAKWGMKFVSAATMTAKDDELLSYFLAKPKPTDAACRWFLARLNEIAKD